MAIAQTRNLSAIKFATIHHSAVKGVPANEQELRRRLASHEVYHKTKGYPTSRGELGYTYILYHYAIAGNGAVVNMQDPKYRFWHATDLYKGADSANAWGIGILLEGNFEQEKPTQAQLEGAARIVREWNARYSTKLTIRGHKECAAPSYSTSCPGKFCDVNVIRKLAEAPVVVPPVPVPPNADKATRLDVLAYLEQYAKGERDKSSNPVRKDEWQRALNYKDARAKELK